MKKAGLLESPRRGHFKITNRGLEALREDPETDNVKFLERYAEFLEFRTWSNGGSRRTKKDVTTEPDVIPEQTPLEAIEGAFETIRGELVGELLEQIMRRSPDFFERLVVDLLVRMGYGGTRKDAGRAVGRSGDEGIDGICSSRA